MDEEVHQRYVKGEVDEEDDKDLRPKYIGMSAKRISKLIGKGVKFIYSGEHARQGKARDQQFQLPAFSLKVVKVITGGRTLT